MDNLLKRMISLLMAFCILAGLLPAMVFSANAVDSADAHFTGKTVSILGDSISTMSSVSNDTSANSTLGNNAVYYSGSSGVTLHDTWWQQTIDALGMELLVNNSWSGSTVFYPRKGEDSVGYGDRCVNLHNDTTGEEPDVIVVFLGTNDFSYYQSTLGTANIDYAALITDGGYSPPATTCEAYAIMLHKIIARYPDAEIYCMGMTARRSPDKEDSYADVGQPTAFNAELQTIIEHFGLTYVDLENCGIAAEAEIFDIYMGDARVHPNTLGMDKITEALVSAMLGRDVVLCSVSGEYSGVTNGNPTASIISGEAYHATLTLLDNYSDLCVTVTMGGEDITASCYSDGMISIPAVTGDIVISAAANRVPQNFKWEYHDGELISVGDTENVLTKLAGSNTDGVFSSTRYQLAGSVVLNHDQPWGVEWEGEGSGGFMLSEGASASDAPFFFRRAGNYLNAFGDHDGSKYNNYGVALDTTEIDGSAEHVYRLENRIGSDGTNMIYLLVDGEEVGALNNYYVGGTSQSSTGDWVSGKDFVFNYIGTSSHPLTNYAMEYLAVWEAGEHTHAYTATVTTPTCTEQGYTVYTCSDCSDSYRTPWLDQAAYEGMTIACVGDSITAAYGVTRDETDYVTLLAEQLGMDYIRLGVSGTTLCTDGSRTCNLGKLTESNLNGADVVTIAMGINDFCAAAEGYYELGDIDSTDSSTIYGAVRMWCERIGELRKTDSLSHTQFYFVTPVITSWNNSVTSARNWDQSKVNVHGYTLRDLCNAIIEVAALYDVAVIDLNLLSGMYYNDAQDNNTAVFGGDGVHPGEKGHEMMAAAMANVLLQNNLREDHAHTFGSWIATTWPTCSEGEEQRVCSVCTATERKKLDGQGHTWENGICATCGAEHPNMADFEGKVISIMGDSISTFAGYIPTADGFNREHLARYPQDNLLTDVNETWWMQVIAELDAKLGINDSWRGATLSGAVPVTSGDTGANAAMSNLTRIQNLGSNGTPDVILLYGGTNDLAHVSKVGTFDPETAPTSVDLTTRKWDNLADGFVYTLLRMRHYYPDALIVAMLPTYTASYYSNEKLEQGNAVMKQICDHYNIPCVDLRDSGVTAEHLPDGIHPGEEGMDLITQAVVDALLTRCEMEPGENVVYSVSHNLTNVTASLGHYKGISAGNTFEEILTGEEKTVAVMMDGLDITESCWADGVVRIPKVTGDVVITAQGRQKTIYEDHLLQLPENAYNTTNLWEILDHDSEYYAANGWTVHSSGSVGSVTIPVTAGDQLWATSFGAAGGNGGNLNGIRVTFFAEDGVLVSMSADQVYAEFSGKGYLEVPENAVAVCVPMWTAAGELYVLTLPDAPRVLKDYIYTLDEENGTVTLTKYTGTDTAVTVSPEYLVDSKVYATVLDASSVFRGNSSLTSVKIHAGVGFKDNSMAYLFSECKKLVTVDMTGVDTSAVTDMGCLFDWCSKLSAIAGYENWDTGSLLNMYKMFNRTSALTKIDLSAWDLSQVINSGWCFQLCMASEILLPDSLKTISAGFLNHATQVSGTTFTIPSGVKKIGYAHTIYDFATNDFVEFEVAEGNTGYVAIDGILYSADGREMLAIPRNKTFEGGIYEIPEGVTFLGELSFSRNYNIHTLVLPNSLEIRNVPLYDPEYIVFEDVGNLNAGNSLSIAIYCYTGITDYAVKDDNPNYASADGILYSKDMTTVVAVPSRYNKHMNIPEGVTTWLTEALWVGDSTTVDNLMANCTGISIPASLTNIAEDQIAKLNKLHGMFASFTIEVSEDNPVYCTDADGFLVVRTTLRRGDLDLDGDVDSDDLTLLARHVGGIEPVMNPTALYNADVNTDGKIDSDDLTKHARFVGGIITDWDQE